MIVLPALAQIGSGLQVDQVLQRFELRLAQRGVDRRIGDCIGPDGCLLDSTNVVRCDFIIRECLRETASG